MRRVACSSNLGTTIGNGNSRQLGCDSVDHEVPAPSPGVRVGVIVQLLQGDKETFVYHLKVTQRLCCIDVLTFVYLGPQWCAPCVQHAHCMFIVTLQMVNNTVITETAVVNNIMNSPCSAVHIITCGEKNMQTRANNV